MFSIQSTPIVYTLDGKKARTAVSQQIETNNTTILRPNDFAVVKIGEKSVKNVIK
ncbi:MAG: hypothetical protein IKH59_01410 [Bacteroidaceae bacterium]|nr:hypothetical protein [Bacteroidaceae bacterium]